MILSAVLAVSVLPDDNSHVERSVLSCRAKCFVTSSEVFCHVERSVLSCRAKSRHLNINVCR